MGTPRRIGPPSLSHSQNSLQRMVDNGVSILNMYADNTVRFASHFSDLHLTGSRFHVITFV